MTLTHDRWLAEQLRGWEREGIVTADAARLLRARYVVEPRVGLAQTIVGAVGALLLGTGLIAVLASNWDDFPRWVRLGLALGPLAASQAVSWWVLGRGAAAKPWVRESAAFVQTLAAGAAMALASQIYNMPGAWSDLVFWWCVVAVPLAWALQSDAVAIAYLVGIAVWTVAQAEARGNWFSAADVADVRIWFPLLLAGVLPRWPGPGLRDRPEPGSRLVLAGAALVGLLAVAAGFSLLACWQGRFAELAVAALALVPLLAVPPSPSPPSGSCRCRASGFRNAPSAGAWPCGSNAPRPIPTTSFAAATWRCSPRR